MSYRLQFELPGLPDSPNRRQNASWKSTHFKGKKWKDWVVLTTRAQRPLTPLERSRISLVRYSSVEMDPDNLAASFKPVIDGLRLAGIIKNDKRENVVLTFDWVKTAPKLGKILVIVEELEVCTTK